MADVDDFAPLLSATTLPLHADAAAFFVGRGPPSPPLLLLAVATYELVAEKNERLGGIHLFDASKGELTPLGGVGSGSSSSSSSSSGGEGESAAAPRFPGVFDIKWMPARDEEESRRPTLGVALADGSVRLMEVAVEKGGKSAVLRETARCFPLRAGGGEEGEEEGKDEEEEGKDEEEEGGGGAAPSLPSHPLDDPRAMALFLDVGRGGSGDDPTRIAVSFSDGRVAVLEATTATATTATEDEPSSLSTTTRNLETRALWRAHDAECWCVSFGNGSGDDRDTLYTGADDCEFLAWDLSEIISGKEEKNKLRPVWRAGGSGGKGEGEGSRHSAGVCCIAPSPGCAAEGGDNLIATGSYDGRVRVWDVSRGPREPLFVCASAAEGEGEGEAAASSSSPPSSSSAPLGGGAWRLVWHPGGEPRLLCAAMHAGFAVLRLVKEEEEEARRLEVEQRYRGHGADPSPLNGGAATLGYGCDWAFFPADGENGGEKRLVAATASFYDNAVHLWEPRGR